MKFIFALLTLSITAQNIFAQDAKVVTDCTVTYDVSVADPKADPQIVKSMQGASKVVYIKDTKVRSDFSTPRFKQTILYDSKSDSTIILREIGATKYISYFNQEKRKQQNAKFEGIQYKTTDERKVILGYDCVKTVALLKDGSTYNVFYTPAFKTLNIEYEYQFKDLPGFVLAYDAQTEDGKTKVTYTASKITLLPTAEAIFDIPKNGYRVL